MEGIVGGVVDQLWRQGDVYWHHGDYPRIVALDRIITQADPQFLEAYATGGWLMDSLGRRQDAEAFYTLGTRNNPQAAYAYWNLGFFYFNTTHDYPAAARAFLKDTEQADAQLNDWKMLAHSYEKAGEWDAAVATWQTIKTRWPNGMSVDRLLGEAEEKRRKAQAADSHEPCEPPTQTAMQHGDRLPLWVVILLVVFLVLRVGDLAGDWGAKQGGRLSQTLVGQVDEKTMSSTLTANWAAKTAFFASFGQPGKSSAGSQVAARRAEGGGNAANRHAQRPDLGPPCHYPARPAASAPAGARQKSSGPGPGLSAVRAGRSAARRQSPVHGGRTALGRCRAGAASDPGADRRLCRAASRPA